MKFKKILFPLLFIVLSANLFLIFSGNTHLYKGIANTYLKGRSGPTIDELDIFSSREIKAQNPIPWAISKSYNSKIIGEKESKYIDSLETTAFLIIKDDSIQFEKYWENYDALTVSNSFSMGKTVVSILIGIAIDEGRINSVEDYVSTYLPEYSKGKNSELKIKHLLTMSSGMNFDESYGDPFGFAAKAYYGEDLKGLISEYSVTETPGVSFKYLSGNTQILAFILEKVCGKKMSQYAQEKLWSKIGAENDAFWVLDKEKGDEKAFTGLYATAKDYAKIGRLYMAGGDVFNNKVISAKYVFKSVTPADLVNDHNQPIDEYGYSWWLMDYKNQNIFYMRGIFGQYVICLPQKNMIIVRLGRKREDKSDNKHPDDVYFYIDQALKMIN